MHSPHIHLSFPEATAKADLKVEISPLSHETWKRNNVIFSRRNEKIQISGRVFSEIITRKVKKVRMLFWRFINDCLVNYVFNKDGLIWSVRGKGGISTCYAHLLTYKHTTLSKVKRLLYYSPEESGSGIRKFIFTCKNKTKILECWMFAI